MRRSNMIAAFAMALMFGVLIAGCGSKTGEEADGKDHAAVSDGQAGRNDNVAVSDVQKGGKDHAAVSDVPADEKNGTLGISDAADTTGAPESVNPGEEKYVVVLDPGHGGLFSGAVDGSLVEKELTLAIGLKIREYINNNYSNVSVRMTRETDTELSTDVVEDLELRCEYAKSVDADILVSLHLNASEDHTSYGANMYISHMENVKEDSERLAACILSKITSLGIADYGIHTRNSSDHFDDSGSPLDYYAINRHCAARDIPGIIVEHCFIDNEGDQSYIASDEALDRLAAADAEGIVEYLFSGN